MRNVFITAQSHLSVLLQSWRSVSWLTLILLTWTKWWAPTNASKWRMGFNSAFKGLIYEENQWITVVIPMIIDIINLGVLAEDLPAPAFLLARSRISVPLVIRPSGSFSLHSCSCTMTWGWPILEIETSCQTINQSQVVCSLWLEVSIHFVKVTPTVMVHVYTWCPGGMCQTSGECSLR